MERRVRTYLCFCCLHDYNLCHGVAIASISTPPDGGPEWSLIGGDRVGRETGSTVGSFETDPSSPTLGITSRSLT